MRTTLLFSLLLISLSATAKTSIISTQKEFDSAIQKVRNGESVDIRLKPGIYDMGAITANAPLKISGKGAVIKGLVDIYSKKDAIRKEDGFYICRLTSPIPAFSLFLDSRNELIPISESTDSKTLVNLCSEVKGKFSSKIGAKVQIPVPSSVGVLEPASVNSTYGYFDCGWRVGIFTVSGIENGDYLCTLLNRIDTPTFNYEKTFYERDIRYVIYNAERKKGCINYTGSEIFIPEEYESIQIMKAGSKPVLTAKSDLNLDGIEFLNFGKIRIESENSETVNISKCTFVNSLTTSIEIAKKASDNLVPCTISDCSFLHCALAEGYTISVKGPFTGKPVVFVENCRMKRYEDGAVMYKNASGMILLNGDAQISGCILTNALRTPVTCYQGCNIVKDNIVFNTEGFNSFPERNLANDFGMIYVNLFTNKASEAISNTLHRVLIENNLIYGARSNGYDARGIMIDDGRGDVICRNNVIHVPGTYYSMGSRECPHFIGTSSIRNVFEKNIVTTRYRLQGGTDFPETYYPVTDSNILLGEMVNENFRIHIKNQDVEFKDAVVEGVVDGKLVVDSKTRKALKKLTHSKYIK